MRYVICGLALVVLAACGTDPSGPVVNNSGSDNVFNFAQGEGSDGGDVTTPAPVVITPVVIAPVTPETVGAEGDE